MRLSVILPTLNEAENLSRAIASLRAQGPCEIIVVDAGSVDGTFAIARAEADIAITSARGRAAQMNTGAAQASGELLLFLHADCLLEAGAFAQLETALERKNTSAACFSMRADAEGVAYRCIDWCASGRVRLTGIIYGDQGLGMRRELFQRIGGFPRAAFMEDVLISQSLRALGRMVVLPARILVSPRRWRKHGILRQTLRNWMLTALALGGVHPDDLARFYPANK